MKVLEELGLSPNEAKIYETLLSAGKVSINALAVESNVHRRNVYDSIDKLVKKGLASEEFIKGVKYVRAVNPARLLDIVREKEAKVSSVMPELEEMFRRISRKDEAAIYRGIEGFKNYLNDILEVNETVHFIGAKAFWLDERLKYFLPKFDRQRIRQGICFRHIYDHEVRTMSPEILALRMNEYKFFPPEYSSSMAIDIFGDHVVTFYGVSPGHLAAEPVQFTVVSEKLSDGYRKYFNFMWERLGRAQRRK